MSIRIRKREPSSADVAADALKAGKVAIVPADTIYGFSGIVPSADSAIRAIKGREETKPFIQLIAFPEDLRRYADVILPDFLSKLWPGPVTIIVSNREGGTTAFRYPDDEWLHEVLVKTGSAIYSTSVNLAGCESLWRIEDIMNTFGDKADLIVDDGDKPGGVASTIVSFLGGVCKIVRQGAVQIQLPLQP